LWGSFGALAGGKRPTRLTEQLAVELANRNHCGYCLAAHTAPGQGDGVNAADLGAAQTVRAAGFSDAELVELIAHTALNLYTNYLNITLDVPFDFPVVALQRAA
jgi:AhpD family alkylhydroperoxidase